MKIRPYSKSELAQAYAPEITSQAALNRLAAWIRLNRPLTEALRQTGYYTKQRLFSNIWENHRILHKTFRLFRCLFMNNTYICESHNK